MTLCGPGARSGKLLMGVLVDVHHFRNHHVQAVMAVVGGSDGGGG